jgi:formylglycine-generating enzyme required for sulfatase activity
MDKCPEPVYYNPQKNCTRPQQFWMSRYEITLGEYMKYCFEKNEDFPLNKTAINFKSMQPVDVGDYDENAGGFCYWFGKKHGVNARLPLPDEWEFAARGGNATDPFWGNGNAGDYCWFADNSSGKMHQVGLKKPNPYGLYDIIGNLWEWCEGSNLRGGGYNSYPSEFRYSVIHQLPVQRHDMGTVYDTQGAGFRMIIMVKDY